MREKKHIAYIVFFLLCCSWAGSFAQNEHKIWYFGEHAGLDFNTFPPTVLTNSAMVAPEGCSSVADASGQLLFYTNGETIYNRNHVPMANGTGLNGSVQSAQSSLIVGLPDSDTEYYLFTTDADGGTGGLQYHVVDMAANGGLGTVTLKNQVLLGSVSEKLTATLDDTGNNTWIMAHGMGDANFYAYLLTNAGLNPTPVVSNAGPVVVPGSGTGVFRGTMKISPNGEFMTLMSPDNSGFHTFTFDNTSGQVTYLLDATLVITLRNEILPPQPVLWGRVFAR